MNDNLLKTTMTTMMTTMMTIMTIMTIMTVRLSGKEPVTIKRKLGKAMKYISDISLFNFRGMVD